MVLLLFAAACSESSDNEPASPCGNPALDRIHCGSCDVICPADAVCIQGACACQTAGEQVCFGSCLDTLSDDQNCGGCGVACGSGEACDAGACVCKPGRERCGENCFDTSTHAAHCGGCDNACAVGARCAQGACACPDDRVLCGGSCLDTSDDDENCGACGNICPEFTACTHGTCRCNDGFGTLCGDACIDVRTDEDNCGACGETCVLGAKCLGGECACRGDNPATCDDRCVDLDQDAFHCGGCGQACGPGQDCVDGACRCQGLLDDCDGFCANVGADPAHCGGCGVPCADGQACCGGECFDGECPERPLDVACTEEIGPLSFDVPASTGGWLFSTWVPDGFIAMSAIETPADSILLNSGNYAFARRGTIFLDTVHPLHVPMRPELSGLVTSGPHSATYRASGPPCYALASASGEGTTIRVRVHLTGAPGLNAENAPRDPRIVGAFARANRVLAPAGVELVVSDFLESSRDIATRYGVIREIDEVFELVATSDWPGLTPQSRLQLNVFVIQFFSVPAGGEVLGVSAGIPGAAGVHGTRASGVVVSIRDDTTLLGNVLAHEVGHFLGLFHTTEVYGQRQDPLTDTPHCPGERWNDPGSCPGADNLMFPYAVPGAMNLTADQVSVVRANPLVR